MRIKMAGKSAFFMEYRVRFWVKRFRLRSGIWKSGSRFRGKGCRWLMNSSGDSGLRRLQRLENFRVLRETVHLFFGKDQLAVVDDFKTPTG